MYYFVIGSDNQRYGPADVDTLVSWAREGRIIPSTTLVERGTEREVLADSLTALRVVLEENGSSPAVVVERTGSPPTTEAPTLTQVPPSRPTRASNPVGQPPPPMGQPDTAQTMAYASFRPVGRRNKIVAGLLGIFLGGFGVHRFYLGYIGIGILQIILNIFSFGIVGSLWGFIEGIVCLCGGMRDADGNELRD